MEDKIKKEIQRLVPEIMELKFGCMVKCRFDAIGFPNEGSLEHHPAIESIGYVTHDDYLEVGHHFQDLQISEIRNGYLGEDYDGMFCEILGRPITLADVLLAINKIYKNDGFATIASNGWFHLGKGRCFWDLTKPYDDQIQETKDFIGNILGVK